QQAPAPESPKPPAPESAPPRPAIVAYPAGYDGARKPIIGATPTAPAPAVPVAPAAEPAPAAARLASPDPTLQPSWETQKLARNFVFSIPAPRGQITDRTGVPLAQTRVAHNLAIHFPAPPQLSDQEAGRFIDSQVRLAQTLTGRNITVDAARALKHYKERGMMPFVIAQDLKPEEVARLKRDRPPGLIAVPLYLRWYPQGSTAAHLVGFVGRQGGFQSGPVENNELLWPEYEGRDGLEKSFNTQLTGKFGVMNLAFDSQGRKSSEKVATPPRPGQNVVTTLDLTIQKVVERNLRARKRPCAMVVMDPSSGEILAMASEPSFDPNIYIPSVASDVMDRLTNDPFNPLYPRAFRAAYPPGSIFKIITGLAAMNEGIVDPDDRFGGEAVITVGGTKFRNWKKKDVGPLDFPEALTQSCNTYFYKMGLKAGHRPILDYSARLGLGSKTGIPIAQEERGNLMTTEYMLRAHNRRIMPGDIANMSIGQGDTLVTPIQMAAAMCTVASGGTVFQPRLVRQVQDIDAKITFGYDVRVRDQIHIHRDVMKALKDGLIGVVSSRSGTASRAGVPGFKVAGKTGTAQWGAGKSEKVAAWFVGFAPVERPQYAFAVVYEGRPGDDDVHGGTNAAPIVGQVLKEILIPEPKAKKAGLRKKRTDEDDPDDNEDAPPRRRKTEEVVQ
ncbi:MAG: penicillin-binding protein 2, partial [Chthoniobacteraceae bacterium]